MNRITGGFPDFHADPGNVFIEGSEVMLTMQCTGPHENECIDTPADGPGDRTERDVEGPRR
jgi:SnoaL-like polyketide cyclase.